jgi:FMN phosphatase YigB (HAD superfamily)
MWRAVCFDLDGTLASYDGDFDELLDTLRTDLGLLACDFGTFRRRLARALKRDGPVTLESAPTETLGSLGLRVPDDLASVAEQTVARYAGAVRDDPTNDIAGAESIGMAALLIRGRKSGHEPAETAADLEAVHRVLRERVEAPTP